MVALFEQDDEMRQALLDAAEKLDPSDDDTPRGDSQRERVARNLIQIINENTQIRVTRMAWIENVVVDNEDLADTLEEIIEEGSRLREKFKTEREKVLEEFDAEILDGGPDHGYVVEVDGEEYSVVYPDEVIAKGMESVDEEEVPEKVQEFAVAYWAAWDERVTEFGEFMQETGFEQTGSPSGYSTVYRVSRDRIRDVGGHLEISVSPHLPYKPIHISVRSEEQTYWDPHQLWERFDDPAGKDQSPGDASG